MCARTLHNYIMKCVIFDLSESEEKNDEKREVAGRLDLIIMSS